MAHSRPDPETLRRGHQPSDVNVRRLFTLVGLFIVAAIVLHLALAGLLVVFDVRAAPTAPPPAFVEERPAAPPPNLQAAPVQEFQAYRATGQARLSSYGWVDRDAGIVRIPIDRAMELLLQRGLPVATPVPEITQTPRAP